MSKSEVYSWRVSPDLKRRLEDAAHATGKSIGRLLEDAVEAWLQQSREVREYETEQQRLRAILMKHAGTIRGGDPRGSVEAKERVRRQIVEKIERQRRRAPPSTD